MTAHLHLHLEPEVRKRGESGTAEDLSGDVPDRFFASHSLERLGRPRMEQADLVRYVASVEKEQRAQGVSLVELRLSPRRFLHDGMSWETFVGAANEAMRETADPVVRGIILLNRDSPLSFVEEVSERLSSGLPGTFVGLDLAGDERRFPGAKRFAEAFATGRSVGLGVTVHAGEFGGVREIWEALDVLGATRLGHALSGAKDAALVRRLACDDVLVETSLGSNSRLGAGRSLSVVSARIFLDGGVPVSFNSDIPLHTGLDLGDEMRLASSLLGVDRDEFTAMQVRALKYSFV